MSEKTASPDLSTFENEYDIVGELDSPEPSARIFVANRKTDDARRREDRTAVLITVVSTPPGDEANALTQYAADTGTLTGLTHRRLVPVLDSRWVGKEAFAVVTQRVMDPTLAARLETGETFHSTRIAAILREVNGLLEWAREQRIVHRRVTPHQIFLEPNTDRVRVMFAISPISRLKQPGPHDDARTIARLAVAMLGGDPNIETCDEATLAELRPGLPQLFCEATSKLLDPRDTATPDDVAAYLGLIGMADPLVQGETERDRIRAEILEEQRVEREKLANERIEFDRKTAEERAAFEAEIAAERAAFEKVKAEERARVENERLELEKAVTKERTELQQALAAERAALLAKRTELEKTVADQRAEIERAAASDRAEIERLRAEIRRAGDLEVEKKRLTALEDITGEEDSVLDDEELVTPMFALPMLPPLEPVTFDDETPVLSDEKIVFAPLPQPAAPADGEDDAAHRTTAVPGTARRRNRVLMGAAAGIIALAAVSAAIVGSRHTPSRAAPRTSTRAATAASRPRAGQATVVALPTPVQPAPMTFTVDSATAQRWLDSLKHADPVDVPWAMDMARVKIAKAERARLAAERDAAARAGNGTAADTVTRTGDATARADRPVTRNGLSQPRGVRAARRDSISQPAGVRAGAPPDSSVVPPEA